MRAWRWQKGRKAFREESEGWIEAGKRMKTIYVYAKEGMATTVSHKLATVAMRDVNVKKQKHKHISSCLRVIWQFPPFHSGSRKKISILQLNL